nr:MAG TPA: tail length tape measure protein [Caudoviricetes sp.]
MQVRELITLIRYKLDKSSVNSAKATAEVLKSNLNSAGESGEMAGTKIASGAQQAAQGIQKATQAAKTFEEQMREAGNYQDKLGRWHGANGKYIKTTDLQAMQAAAKSGQNIGQSIAQGMRTADRAVKQVGFSMQGLQPIASMVQGAFMGFGQRVFDAVMRIKDAIIETSDRMQELDGKLRNVTNGDAHRGRVKEQLYDVANSSRASMEDAGDLFYKVSRAREQTGLNEQQNFDLTETVGKALTVGGASTQEKSATILQLSQALGSGVLQGDELRSLNENASGLMTEIAKYFNTTVGGLREMGRNGELTSEQVAKAILASKKAIDEQFANMPMKMGDAKTKIGNILKKMLLDFEGATGFFNGLARSLVAPFEGFYSMIQRLAQRMGGMNKVVRLAGIIFGSLAAAIAIVNFAKISTGIMTVVKAVRAFMVANGAALGPVLLIAAAVALIALALEDLYTWITGGESVIGDFLGSFDDFKQKNQWVQDFINSFQRLSREVMRVKDAFVQAFENTDWTPLIGAMQQLGGAVLPLVVGAIELVLMAILGVLEGVNWVIAKFFELMNSGGLVAQILTAFFTGFVEVVTGLFNTLTAVFQGNWSGAIEGVKQMFSGLKDFAIGVLQAIGNAIGTWITDKISTAKKTVMDFLGWSDSQTNAAVENSNRVSLTLNQSINGGASVNQYFENEGGLISD